MLPFLFDREIGTFQGKNYALCIALPSLPGSMNFESEFAQLNGCVIAGAGCHYASFRLIFIPFPPDFDSHNKRAEKMKFHLGMCMHPKIASRSSFRFRKRDLFCRKTKVEPKLLHPLFIPLKISSRGNWYLKQRMVFRNWDPAPSRFRRSSPFVGF